MRSASVLCCARRRCWTASALRRRSGSCFSLGSSHWLPTTPAPNNRGLVPTLAQRPLDIPPPALVYTTSGLKLYTSAKATGHPTGLRQRNRGRAQSGHHQ